MRNRKKAIAYLRTSSAANVGEDKDSATRQRRAISGYARRHRIKIVSEYYDAAVSGADPIHERAGFAEILNHIGSNGVGAVLVESPDRFARDLTVQLVGHDMLKTLGVELIPVNAPDFFTDETPTAVMVQQILGAVSQFQKAELVARLKAARLRSGNLGGPERYSKETILLAKRLYKKNLSLRKVGARMASLGHLNRNGKPYAAQSVKAMVETKLRRSRVSAPTS